MPKAVITVGLGFGDEGKGATVDYLCRLLSADLVVRYSGGCQCGHNVVLPDGKHHCFSQFGAGTLAGADTYLGRHVIVDPLALDCEALHLQSLGIGDPFRSLFAHPSCLVTSVFSIAVNRWKETNRNQRHGSCGQGIGETRGYWLKYGRDALTLGDLKPTEYEVAVDKLELQKYRYLNDPELEGMKEELESIQVRYVVEQLIDASYPIRQISRLPDSEVAIYEGAQGILLDEFGGFQPHTTWSTVTARHALEMIPEGTEIVTVGVTRPYMTRHGEGPLPTEEESTILDTKHNPHNDWQGRMRFGNFDRILFEYALENAGTRIDCLAVNCIDHMEHEVSVLVDEYNESDVSKHLQTKHHTFDTYLLGPFLKQISEYTPIGILGRGPSFTDRELTDVGKKILGVANVSA